MKRKGLRTICLSDFVVVFDDFEGWFGADSSGSGLQKAPCLVLKEKAKRAAHTNFVSAIIIYCSATNGTSSLTKAGWFALGLGRRFSPCGRR